MFRYLVYIMIIYLVKREQPTAKVLSIEFGYGLFPSNAHVSRHRESLEHVLQTAFIESSRYEWKQRGHDHNRDEAGSYLYVKEQRFVFDVLY